jgi:hypothetical protein
LIEIVPTSALSGVPVNVRVAAVNVSQLGNTPPSAFVAEYVSESPTSTSANVLAAKANVKAESSVAF